MARLSDTVEPPHRKRATSLRLAGALHYAVLTEADLELAAFYPAADPRWQMSALWPVANAYLEREFEAVAAFIQSDPQTNETRRTIALLPGFLEIATRFGRPLHLLELGASAGLNQNWDKFSYRGETWQRPALPDTGVVVDTDWRGPAPDDAGQIEIASRRACDLNPIHLGDPAARLRLKSYTWPDQTERLARLDAAMRLALETGVNVEQGDAADWLEQTLADRPSDAVTVIYHSVFLHYPPITVRERILAAIEQAGLTATDAAPVAWLCMEPVSVFESDNPKLGEFQVRLKTWPDGRSQKLARTDGHVTYVERLDEPIGT